MIVIWSGFGILVVVALILGGICGVMLGVNVTRMLQLGDGPILGSLMVGSIGGCATLACYGLQRLLESTDKGRLAVDKKTGEELLIKRGDALFFIPVRWWTRIVATITVVAFAAIIIFGFFDKH